MKVVENSPQNARNCTIFKKFLGGPCPQTPLAKACSFAAHNMALRGMYIQNPRNFKVGPPPSEKSCIRPCIYVWVYTLHIEYSTVTKFVYKLNCFPILCQTFRCYSVSDILTCVCVCIFHHLYCIYHVYNLYVV